MDYNQYEQRVYEILGQLSGLADEFWKQLQQKKQPSDIFMFFQHQLEHQLRFEPRKANAIVNLGLHCMIEKQEKRQHFQQHQLIDYWNTAFPNIPNPWQNLRPETAQGQSLPPQGQGFPPAGQGF